MNKDVIIRYLPSTTTQEEIKQIRDEFNSKQCNKDTTLILMISGQNNLLTCLQSLINID